VAEVNHDVMTLAVSAGSADKYTLLLLVAGVGAAGGLLLRRDARLIACLWLASVCFIPIWIGVTYSVYVPAVTLFAFVSLVALVPVFPRHVGPADYGAAFLLVACFLPVLTGGATRATVLDLLLQAPFAFALGRLLPLKVSLDWLYRCMSYFFGVVSLLALIEFLTHSDPFLRLSQPNALFHTWGTLQARGGIVRAEGAFGHSIALGSSVAMIIPLTLTSSLRSRTKAALVGLMLGCTVVSFSRTAMLAGLLGVVLSVVFLRKGLSVRVRVTVIAVCGAVAIALVPLVSSVFATAGSEATGSAAYRGRLTSLIPDMAVLGTSPAAHRTPAGDLYMGNFRSIDSALILFGLTYGWLPLLLAAMLLAGAIVVVLARHGSAPTIAIVAQLPALATVALITQYGVFVWFIAGLALYAQAETIHTTGPPPDAADYPQRNPGDALILATAAYDGFSSLESQPIGQSRACPIRDLGRLKSSARRRDRGAS